MSSYEGRTCVDDKLGWRTRAREIRQATRVKSLGRDGAQVLAVRGMPIVCMATRTYSIAPIECKFSLYCVNLKGPYHHPALSRREETRLHRGNDKIVNGSKRRSSSDDGIEC